MCDRKPPTEAGHSYQVQARFGKPGLCLYANFDRADFVALAGPFPCNRVQTMSSRIIERLIIMALSTDPRVVEPMNNPGCLKAALRRTLHN
jgi:hypothetical protein